VLDKTQVKRGYAEVAMQKRAVQSRLCQSALHLSGTATSKPDDAAI